MPIFPNRVDESCLPAGDTLEEDHFFLSRKVGLDHFALFRHPAARGQKIASEKGKGREMLGTLRVIRCTVFALLPTMMYSGLGGKSERE